MKLIAIAIACAALTLGACGKKKKQAAHHVPAAPVAYAK